MNKKLKNLLLVLGVVTVSLGALSGCGKKDSAESEDNDYTIKVGYYNCDHMTAAPIAKAAGIYDKLGLKVELTGNGKVPQAMAAGQMDAGYIGIGNVLNSPKNNVPLVIGANNHEGGSYYLVVSNDINEPKDLLGKTLGIGSKPEEDLSWATMAKELNIPVEGSNYDAINMNSIQDSYVALKSGQIKGYTACDPWGSMAEYEKVGKIMKEYVGPEGDMGLCCAFTLNKNFVKEHRKLAEKLVQAHVEAIKFMYEHPVQSSKMFAEAYKVPEEVGLMTIYKKTATIGRTITWKMDEEDAKREIKARQDIGSVDKNVKYEDVVDNQLLDELKVEDFDQYIKEKVDPIFPLGMSYEDWKTKANEIDK